MEVSLKRTILVYGIFAIILALELLLGKAFGVEELKSIYLYISANQCGSLSSSYPHRCSWPSMRYPRLFALFKGIFSGRNWRNHF